MVLTENAKGEIEVLKKQGIDISAHGVSVEQSILGMKKVVSKLFRYCSYLGKHHASGKG
jgi:hypothetical protein